MTNEDRALNGAANEFPVRPEFPRRAVVTAGMPYGNKQLHFGHIGGVFIHADVFARFLRDRIGRDNVIFVSGTDCYGATIEIGYEQRRSQGFAGTESGFCRPHLSHASIYRESSDNRQGVL